jgi:hypothetical protein
MRPDELRNIARRQPFQPFILHMNDGSRLKVTQPDNFLMPPAWRNFGAIVAFDDGRFSVIAVRNIAHVTSRGAWPKTSGRRRRNGSSGEGE